MARKPPVEPPSKTKPAGDSFWPNTITGNVSQNPPELPFWPKGLRDAGSFLQNPCGGARRLRRGATGGSE
jgi:hypothetical protein